jgi:hypothetical protein
MAMATVIGVLLVPMLFVLIEKLTRRGVHGGNETGSSPSTTQATGTHG